MGKVAPQLIFRTDAAETTHQHESVDLIAFDPAEDFTIQPWLAERLNRPLRQGDVIIGGRRQERVGDELLVFGTASDRLWQARPNPPSGSTRMACS